MMNVRHFIPSIALLCCVALLPGCAKTAPKTYKVAGKVMLDGQPLPDGNIQFLPDDRSLSIDGGTIEDGEFEFMAKPGQKKVTIRAARPDPRLRAVNGEPIPVDYIPDRYNLKTTLTAEVLPSNDNRFEFQLTLKGSPK